MNFPVLKSLLQESKVFNVLADELLEINVLAANTNLGPEAKERIKKLFKELHSSSPDLNAIHAEIEAMKKELGETKVDSAEESEENKVLSTAGSTTFSQDEKDDFERMLDLNVKIARSSNENKAELRDRLKELRKKIGSMSASDLSKELDDIEASL